MLEADLILNSYVAIFDPPCFVLGLTLKSSCVVELGFKSAIPAKYLSKTA